MLGNETFIHVTMLPWVPCRFVYTEVWLAFSYCTQSKIQLNLMKCLIPQQAHREMDESFRFDCSPEAKRTDEELKSRWTRINKERRQRQNAVSWKTADFRRAMILVGWGRGKTCAAKNGTAVQLVVQGGQSCNHSVVEKLELRVVLLALFCVPI